MYVIDLTDTVVGGYLRHTKAIIIAIANHESVLYINSSSDLLLYHEPSPPKGYNNHPVKR